MSDGFLHKYFLNNPNKSVFKWLHYFDIYERHFERFRDKNMVMLEIGVLKGGSVQMWKSYFGEKARIIGVDIEPNCKKHEAEGIEIFIGSQDDPGILSQILEKYPDIDIVLDDGSHQNAHMIASFQFLYPRLKPNGVYMVEDTHACYRKSKNPAGSELKQTFPAYVQALTDELTAWHIKDVVPVTDITKSTDSISFYDSIVVFEKRIQAARQAISTQHM